MQESPKNSIELEAQNSQDYSLDNAETGIKGGRWTHEEDECLRAAVDLYGEKKWKQISTKVSGRTPLQCLHRWTKILRPGLIKGTWSPEENELLREWVKVHGPHRWSDCSQVITGRSGKQCREHWFNKLNPDLKKGNWTAEEDEMIFSLYQKFGTSWSKIEKYLPGRTENAIKNRFYSTLRRVQPQKNNKKVKKEESRGLEPQNSNSEESTFSPAAGQVKNKLLETKIRGPEVKIQKAIPGAQLTGSLAKLPQVKNMNIPKEYDPEFETYLMKVECGSLPVEANSSSEESLDSLEYQYKRSNTRRNHYESESVEGLEESSGKASSKKAQSTDLSSPLSKGHFGNPCEVYGLPQEQNFLNFNPLQFVTNDPMTSSIQDLFSHPLLASNLTPILEPKSGEFAHEMGLNHPAAEEQKIFFILNQLKRLEVMLEATKTELKNRYTELRNELVSQGDLNVSFFDPLYHVETKNYLF